MPPRRKLNETTVRGNTFKVGDSCLINSDAPSSLPFVSCHRGAALPLFVELARNLTPGGHETHGVHGRHGANSLPRCLPCPMVACRLGK